jgi:hypothetical protein
MNSRLFVGLLLVCVVSVTSAQGPYDAEWTTHIGTSARDGGEALAMDASGNIYLTGFTEGDIGGSNMGSVDGFLTKMDSDGNEIWSRQLGTSSGDAATSVSVDASGNVYVAGRTSGSYGGTQAGNGDVFLTKYNASGIQQWVQQLGTPVAERGDVFVAVDSAGNAYLGGATEGDLGGTSAGNVDGFLARYDTTGSLLWTK